MSISENMQRTLSIFKHEAQLLSFFSLICMSKWYTLHHFDVKGWYRFVCASLLYSDIVTPVWIHTGVPAWSLSLSHFILVCKTQRSLKTMKRSCLSMSTWLFTNHVLSSLLALRLGEVTRLSLDGLNTFYITYSSIAVSIKNLEP